jgi:hypothetical protein
LLQNPFGLLAGEWHMPRIALAVALSAFVVMIVSALAASSPAPQMIYSVASVAAMGALGEEYPNLHLVGYYAGSNRGGGYFSWDASSKSDS